MSQHEHMSALRASEERLRADAKRAASSEADLRRAYALLQNQLRTV